MNSLNQQFVDVDDATLEIFRGGTGSPIVCCQHPHSSNLGFQWYADHTSFVYVVVRGLGNSSPIRERRDLTYLQAAHDLEAVRRKLGIERWVVQGFSAGSQVTLLYALTYPDSLAGLISISGFAKNSRLLANPRSLCSPKYPDYQADLEALGEQRFERSPAVLSSPDHYWAPVNPQAWGFFRGDMPLAIMPGNQLHDRLKAAFEEVVLFDVEDRLKEIQVPTLVVGGRHDPIVPVEESIAVHESIPNSSLLVLEHSGHGAQGEDEAIFKDTALRFLSQLTT
jgi:pimeloyl-ACP methyl ester carboxylesterase